jgi:FkbM family methyltransferase
MRSLEDVSPKIARRLSAWLLRQVGPELRAEALETLTEEMVTEVPVPGGSLTFYTPSPMPLFRATSALSKERETITWIDSFKAGEIFWDVGANVGVYSLYAAVARNVLALAFEPSAANFHVLSRNIHLNRMCDRITAYCIALSGETRLGFLNMESPLMGTALNQFGRAGDVSPYSEKDASLNAHGMIGLTIDDMVNQFGAPFPNHIKLDVDGLELDILRGAAKTLHDQRLASLLVELNVTDGVQADSATRLLEKAGLHLIAQGPPQVTLRQTGVNHIFERNMAAA